MNGKWRFLFLAFALAAWRGPAAETWNGDGLLLTHGNEVPVLFLCGTPEEMGRQHGALLQGQIHKTYQLMLLVAGGYLYLKDDWFFDRIAEVQKRSSAALPERFLQELDAMSAAAGLTQNQGREMNFFPELFHCSGIAVRGKATVGGKVIHARVLDYMRDIGLEDCALLQVFMPTNYNAWISVGFTGLNGTVTAMNAKGLAMGELGGRGEGKWDGLPMSYLMRRVMEECASVREAVALIQKVPLTCSYYYVISDKSGDMAGISADAGKPPVVLHAGEKHPLLQEVFDDVVYLTAPSRQKALVERLRANYGKIDVEAMENIIKRPVAMRSNLHNAIFLPETLDVFFAYSSDKSPACDQSYHRENLGELLRRYRETRFHRDVAPR